MNRLKITEIFRARSLKIRRIMQVLTVVCLSGFAFFVLIHQNSLYCNATGKVKNHANVVASSVWNFEKQSPTAYLQLAAESNGYTSVVIFDTPEKKFLSIDGPALSSFDALLHSIGFVPVYRIEQPIVYEGRAIGSIVAHWPNRAVYVYLYIFWCITLLLIVCGLFLKLLDGKKNLEQKVRQRTAELESEVQIRLQAEERARRQAKRLAIHVQHTPLGVIEWDLDFKVVEWNLAAERIFEYTREEALGRVAYDLILPPEAAVNVQIVWQQLLSSTGGTNSTNTNQTKSGKIKTCEWYNTPLTNEHGVLFGVASLVLDCTEKMEAASENRKLQSQLLQVQKMEAIGKLAGGVAHDFNNMLGVILGHCELAMSSLERGTPLFATLQEIRKAAERSAQITRQLLAFARKQTITPKVLDLNELIEGMLNMLQRLLGEGVDLIWLPGNDLWQIEVDPSQVDQILVNLCVNARDALKGGLGKLTVETENSVMDEDYCRNHAGFVPGEYVRISISDNGCGMDKETLGHIFEPFFTTKGVGEGTGLGMATVYGAIKQSKGFINVYSEPGQGTTVSVYLPRTVQEAQRVDLGGGVPMEGGHETILLVEDDEAVLQMTSSMLQLLGYTVFSAQTPNEALVQMREQNASIDLLLTDVIMPEMNGLDLMVILKEAYPNLKWLFASGYTGNVIAQHGILEEDTPFIQKPFTITQLAAAVRKALHRSTVSDPTP
ncbi:MAG: ATP-binding protein [Desulfobulbus sp.]